MALGSCSRFKQLQALIYSSTCMHAIETSRSHSRLCSNRCSGDREEVKVAASIYGSFTPSCSVFGLEFWLVVPRLKMIRASDIPIEGASCLNEVSVTIHKSIAVRIKKHGLQLLDPQSQTHKGYHGREKWYFPYNSGPQCRPQHTVIVLEALNSKPPPQMIPPPCLGTPSIVLHLSFPLN